MGFLGDAFDFISGHASAKNLQNDAQSHDSHMFHMQAGHDKDMFGLESDFASAMAKKQHQRQRQLLYDSPRLQMEGLKNAGLNPILAATGGFKSPAGGSLPIPSARASSSAKGAGQASPPGVKMALGEYKIRQEQAKYIDQQRRTSAKHAELYEKQKDKTEAETVGKNFDNLVKRFNTKFYTEAESGLMTMDKVFQILQEFSLSGAFKNAYERFGMSPKEAYERLKELGEEYIGNRNSYKGGTGGRNRRNK
jgi:hypothetical protein